MTATVEQVEHGRRSELTALLYLGGHATAAVLLAELEGRPRLVPENRRLPASGSLVESTG